MFPTQRIARINGRVNGTHMVSDSPYDSSNCGRIERDQPTSLKCIQVTPPKVSPCFTDRLVSPRAPAGQEPYSGPFSSTDRCRNRFRCFSERLDFRAHVSHGNSRAVQLGEPLTELALYLCTACVLGARRKRLIVSPLACIAGDG